MAYYYQPGHVKWVFPREIKARRNNTVEFLCCSKTRPSVDLQRQVVCHLLRLSGRISHMTPRGGMNLGQHFLYKSKMDLVSSVPRTTYMVYGSWGLVRTLSIFRTAGVLWTSNYQPTLKNLIRLMKPIFQVSKLCPSKSTSLVNPTYTLLMSILRKSTVIWKPGWWNYNWLNLRHVCRWFTEIKLLKLPNNETRQAQPQA